MESSGCLPDINECRCQCHSPVFGVSVAHVVACCNGQSLAWGGWGLDGTDEMVADPVTFGKEP